MYEGPHTVAAVILETVTGTNGIIVPPDGYLQSIREICDRHGILLITDEVMAGWGRTGRWFGVDNWDVVPDIITTAKGINSGYVPLGAMTVRDHVYDAIKDRFFAGGLTYSRPPARVRRRRSRRSRPSARRGSSRTRPRWASTCARSCRSSPSATRRIGEVRGLGLFWGLELVRNRETREPLVPFNAGGEAAEPMTRMTKACLERGLYPFVALERLRDHAAAEHHARRARRGPRDPRRRPRDRGRVLRPSSPARASSRGRGSG